MLSSFRWPAVALALVVVGSARAASLAAQETAPPSTTTTLPATVEDEDVGFDTPRATMRGFLWAALARDWPKAATHLDLRGRTEAQGLVLARQLKTVLDRKLWVDLDALSNSPEGDPNDGQTRDRDLVGSIDLPDGNRVKILLERLPGDEERQWKISRTTVQQIPALWNAYGDGPLARVLPEPFFDIRFLDVQLWQWIALALLLLASVGLAWLLTAPLLRLVRAVARRTGSHIDNVVANLIIGPLRLALGTSIFLAGIYSIWLAVRPHRVVSGITEALLTIAFAWFVLRLIDSAARVTVARSVTRGRVGAVSAVPLARRSLKVFVGLLAFLAIFQNLGFNATGILAGLGIGGLAVALAAQKSLENFFGGLSLVADHPVRVGDFCKFGTQQGTVEDIGLRSTKVRTLDRTLVTIPNSDFATMQIENFARRDRMRLATTIGLRYETTPDQLRWLLVALKKLLLAHPKVSPDPARVRFVNFGSYSLDIEIFAYVTTSDVDEFMAVREDVFLRIMDLVTESGTGFAFPSQVSYTATDIGNDAERRKAAEAQVASWRAKRALYLPDFPGEQISEISDTLDWPPEGSPSRRGR
ncbi:MAG TPA: mechanosensitive ion channel family protein [Candidatus Binatia bacterium]|nr:mechanosensitive ion channel family protein [Candidatus Binatia bacterium]